MDYSTNFTYLSLEGHVELENYKYIYFILTLIVYMMIIGFNTVIIFVIFKKKRLHEPMYIFIAALLCNSLFGSTALYPKLLIDLLSEKQTVSYNVCLIQAFCLYTYAASEFTLLSAMAYDRYVSICNPLLYANVVKMSTVRKLLFLSFFVPCCELGGIVILTSQLQLCQFKLNRIYCDNFSIVKLSCKETSLNNIYGLFIFVIALFPPVIFILYSYIRILTVCLKNSKDFRRKALQTCLPHLLICIIFSVNISFEIINNRLESKQIPHIMTMILSLEYVLIPPLFNPVIYGLKLQEIYNDVKKIFQCQRRVQVSF
ncbi:putative gustatory receptor clone PTE03 [Neoarius graeffei]|uniref:putative gustatory receptor clone PTE03 n=1 Tax=Neoarius graeffei TaxID=443677 RepID=UPI00298CF9D6|nr:putative gustatory receptor clone PTE03 [Neoarius graeffei]